MRIYLILGGFKLRIISGELKGKKLKVPKNKSIRPTSDRVKEAVFNILGPKVSDGIFLDLFAGSGSIGIEALSRGAKEAVFVDNNNHSLKILKDNLNETNFHNRSRIIYGDCLDIVKILEHNGKLFDIIYMDPPYDIEVQNIIKLIKMIGDRNLLSDDGVLLVEHRKNKEINEKIGVLSKARLKKYGDTYISLYFSI